MKEQDIVIVAAKRTPMGNLLGSLSSLPAPALGAVAHKAALNQAGLLAGDIDEVLTGCVLQAGMGQAPARQAALLADLKHTTGATTINKMCGSGMKALMLAHDLIKAGSINIALAGGMESMSNAPFLLNKARAGYRLGHGQLSDHLFLDGLEDAYDKGKLMGVFAELTAKQFNFNRAMQDEFAHTSMSRALKAQEQGWFQQEIAPVDLTLKNNTHTVAVDETPSASKLAKIASLKPAFAEDGTVTAANSSSISDGAASLILMSAQEAMRRDIKPLARIKAHASHAQAPQWFTTAPIGAINKVLTQANWHKDDVALFEINEVFAVVTMAAMHELQLPAEKVNIFGGACALGHPIGASGARIVVTLLHALQHTQQKRGIAALCIGGGEATAMALELINEP